VTIITWSLLLHNPNNSKPNLICIRAGAVLIQAAHDEPGVRDGAVVTCSTAADTSIHSPILQSPQRGRRQCQLVVQEYSFNDLIKSYELTRLRYVTVCFYL